MIVVMHWFHILVGLNQAATSKSEKCRFFILLFLLFLVDFLRIQRWMLCLLVFRVCVGELVNMSCGYTFFLGKGVHFC